MSTNEVNTDLENEQNQEQDQTNQESKVDPIVKDLFEKNNTLMSKLEELTKKVSLIDQKAEEEKKKLEVDKAKLEVGDEAKASRLESIYKEQIKSIQEEKDSELQRIQEELLAYKQKEEQITKEEQHKEFRNAVLAELAGNEFIREDLFDKFLKSENHIRREDRTLNLDAVKAEAKRFLTEERDLFKSKPVVKDESGKSTPPKKDPRTMSAEERWALALEEAGVDE